MGFDKFDKSWQAGKLHQIPIWFGLVDMAICPLQSVMGACYSVLAQIFLHSAGTGVIM